MKYIRVVDAIKYDGSNLKMIREKLSDFEVKLKKVKDRVEIVFTETGDILTTIDLTDYVVTYPGGFEIIEESIFLLYHQEAAQIGSVLMAKGGDA